MTTLENKLERLSFIVMGTARYPTCAGYRKISQGKNTLAYYAKGWIAPQKLYNTVRCTKDH